MGTQMMNLPVDIPWKRLGASSDMMDGSYGDRRFPKKWGSSVSVFYHEPYDLPEDYGERKITYLNEEEDRELELPVFEFTVRLAPVE